MSKDCRYMDRGLYAVRVGDTRLYGSRYSTIDETYNITIKNVKGGGEYTVAIGCEIKNFAMYGIECFEGTKMLLDKRGENKS